MRASDSNYVLEFVAKELYMRRCGRRGQLRWTEEMQKEKCEDREKAGPETHTDQ